MILAKGRGIAIPVELENQLTAVFNKSQMIMKHSRAWMTAGKIRSDTVSQQTQDYRNIIEGLQVCSMCSFKEESYVHSVAHENIKRNSDP